MQNILRASLVNQNYLKIIANYDSLVHTVLSFWLPHAFRRTRILSQRGFKGLPVAWKSTNQQWVSQHLIRVIVALLFNLLFFTSAPSTTLPGSNFSDKTPQGRWALTNVTHAFATFKANHNSLFHFKGCFTNFFFFFPFFFNACWELSLKSPLMNAVCVTPLPVT